MAREISVALIFTTVLTVRGAQPFIEPINLSSNTTFQNQPSHYRVNERVQPAHEFQRLQAYFSQREILDKVNNQECRKQLELFTNALNNDSLWAVQMLDASAKFPIGLIFGNAYNFGHYDECVQISTESVKGKYCLADIKFRPTRERYPEFYNGYVENQFSLHYDPHKPVWEKFKKTEDPSKRRRDLIHNGICLPHHCSAKDAEAILLVIVKDLISSNDYYVSIKVEEASCSYQEDSSIPGTATAFIYFIYFLVIAMLISTIWDTSRNRTRTDLSTIERVIESFSMHRNMKRLSIPDQNYDLNVFNGMKFYSIALILLGHRCVHTYGSPFFNPQFLEERYRKIQDMFLLNGSLIVDTFFMIGGYLTSYALFKEIEAGRKIRPLQVYLYRWLRITPLYMLIVFFYGYLLEHVGSGPIWKLKVGREASRCRKNWWANLFYVNNYVNNEEMCMFQSWYVSCDMHYTLLAPFIVKAIAKNPKRGLLLLFSIITAATIIPFAYTYYYKHDGVLRVYMQIFEDLPGNVTFSEMYIKSHHRAVPYFIGMGAAYLFLYLQKIDFQFKRWMSWAGSLFCFTSSVWSIWGAWYFYIPGREYDALENATYAATHRLAWALAMAWIPIAGGRRAFGIIQPILSKKSLSPLSKLSFGAFLIHGAVQLYFIGSMRLPEYVFFPKLFWMTAGDILFSFWFAYWTHILFEAPVGGILSILFKPPKKSSNQDATSRKHVSSRKNQ